MSETVVQKYGGASLRSVDQISKVAARILEAQATGKRTVVIVSAMEGETDRLFALGGKIGGKGRELDALVSTGEQVSAALLAMSIQALGGRAISFQGFQLPIQTDSAFNEAQILSVSPHRIQKALSAGQVVVVTGFQGVTEPGDVSTLGRGGSDLTAVAVAAALDAKVCELYKEVPGVMTADPQICAEARPIGKISYDEMLELASLGAKVLQARSVLLAKRYLIPLHVRSSVSDSPGTWVKGEDVDMEGTVVSAISCDRKEARISIATRSGEPLPTAALFEKLAGGNLVVDVIVHDRGADGRSHLTFTVPRSDYPSARRIVDELAKGLREATVIAEEKVAKVSAIGLGMRSHSGVAARMFGSLARERIEVMAVSTSEIKITCVIEDRYAELAVRTLHDEFGLAKEPN